MLSGRNGGKIEELSHERNRIFERFTGTINAGMSYLWHTD
jgi:hypothetical protein